MTSIPRVHYQWVGAQPSLSRCQGVVAFWVTGFFYWQEVSDPGRILAKHLQAERVAKLLRANGT